MEQRIEIDPDNLLTENQDLLHLDFKWLAISYQTGQWLGGEWLQKMELALGAAENVARSLHQTVWTKYCMRRHPQAARSSDRVHSGPHNWQEVNDMEVVVKSDVGLPLSLCPGWPSSQKEGVGDDILKAQATLVQKKGNDVC